MKKTYLFWTMLTAMLTFSCSSDSKETIIPPTTSVKSSTTDINFGDLTIDNFKKLSFTLTNDGNQNIDEITIGSTSSIFTLSAETISLEVGTSKNIEVTFTPTEAINYTGNIEVKIKSKLNPDTYTFIIINLIGTGIGTLPVTYTKDIKPIMTNNCSTIGCHSGTRPKANILLTTYSDVKKSFFGDENYNSLLEIRSGRMPRGGNMLPASQIELIQEWMQTNYTE